MGFLERDLQYLGNFLYEALLDFYRWTVSRSIFENFLLFIFF